MKAKRIEPGPGQESVWDYPRPPRVEDVSQRLRIIFNNVTIVDTQRAKRVLETSHPPTYYIPPEDIKQDFLELTGRASWCEWKGQAGYYTVKVGDRQATDAAWFYPNPTPDFLELKGYVSFYASKMDACYVGEEKVQSQAGDFYGGWITSTIVGPFKGEPGTWGW